MNTATTSPCADDSADESTDCSRSIEDVFEPLPRSAVAMDDLRAGREERESALPSSPYDGVGDAARGPGGAMDDLRRQD